MDLTQFVGYAVWHIVDPGTKIFAAKFVPNIGIRTIWNAFVTMWVNMLSIYSAQPSINLGSAFNSDEKLCRDFSKAKRSSRGTKPYNLLNRKHFSMQWFVPIFAKIIVILPSMDQKLYPFTIVTIRNDTAGPHGIVFYSFCQKHWHKYFIGFIQ